MVRLARELYYGDCTLGKIYLPNGSWFFTLERPWLNNQVGISCIPLATYSAVYRQRPSKLYDYWLKDVPNRSYILIHSGNVASQVQGCILLGMQRGLMNGKRAVFSSVTAVRKFEEIMGGKPFSLEVV